mmetsp:Transcript_33408/g.99497  ORF Transcript_33408/g.99497 Transcript_33408/m.99497 type:complete len:258 (-) Transcript_33408:1756-2529(-)
MQHVGLVTRCTNFLSSNHVCTSSQHILKPVLHRRQQLLYCAHAGLHTGSLQRDKAQLVQLLQGHVVSSAPRAAEQLPDGAELRKRLDLAARAHVGGSADAGACVTSACAHAFDRLGCRHRGVAFRAPPHGARHLLIEDGQRLARPVSSHVQLNGLLRLSSNLALVCDRLEQALAFLCVRNVGRQRAGPNRAAATQQCAKIAALSEQLPEHLALDCDAVSAHHARQHVVLQCNSAVGVHKLAPVGLDHTAHVHTWVAR